MTSPEVKGHTPGREGDWACKALSSRTDANDPQDCDWPVCGCDPYADRVIDALEERSAPDTHVRLLREELEWYGEQARLARLSHSGGDAGRHALAADGGKRARAAISRTGAA